MAGMLEQQASPSELGFAPWDLGFIANPYPVYAELRPRGRVFYDEAIDHWLVPHYSDVNALLRDRRFGRTYHGRATHAEMGRPEEPGSQYRTIGLTPGRFTFAL